MGDSNTSSNMSELKSLVDVWFSGDEITSDFKYEGFTPNEWYHRKAITHKSLTLNQQPTIYPPKKLICQIIKELKKELFFSKIRSEYAALYYQFTMQEEKRRRAAMKDKLAQARATSSNCQMKDLDPAQVATSVFFKCNHSFKLPNPVEYFTRKGSSRTDHRICTRCRRSESDLVHELVKINGIIHLNEPLTGLASFDALIGAPSGCEHKAESKSSVQQTPSDEPPATKRRKTSQEFTVIIPSEYSTSQDTIKLKKLAIKYLIDLNRYSAVPSMNNKDSNQNRDSIFTQNRDSNQNGFNQNKDSTQNRASSLHQTNDSILYQNETKINELRRLIKVLSCGTCLQRITSSNSIDVRNVYDLMSSLAKMKEDRDRDRVIQRPQPLTKKEEEDLNQEMQKQEKRRLDNVFEVLCKRSMTNNSYKYLQKFLLAVPASERAAATSYLTMNNSVYDQFWFPHLNGGNITKDPDTLKSYMESYIKNIRIFTDDEDDHAAKYENSKYYTPDRPYRSLDEKEKFTMGELLNFHPYSLKRTAEALGMTPTSNIIMNVAQDNRCGVANAVQCRKRNDRYFLSVNGSVFKEMRDPYDPTVSELPDHDVPPFRLNRYGPRRRTDGSTAIRIFDDFEKYNMARSMRILNFSHLVSLSSEDTEKISYYREVDRV